MLVQKSQNKIFDRYNIDLVNLNNNSRALNHIAATQNNGAKQVCQTRLASGFFYGKN